MLEALLWDVDGTLAETEHDGHLVAFNQAFEALGVPWRWSEARCAELLTITTFAASPGRRSMRLSAGRSPRACTR